MQKANIGELVFFWTLFGAVGFLAYVTMSPYLTPLFLAAVFAVLFAPLYRRLLKLCRNRESLAALLTVLLVLCLVLLPLMLIGVLLFQEVFTIYGALTKEGSIVALLNQIAHDIALHMQRFVPSFTLHADVASYAENGLRWIAINLNTFFAGILSFMLQIVLIVIAMFFFLRDGKKLRAFAIKLSPLADSYDESIFAKLELAIMSIIKGTLTTAVVQGTLVGVGFAIFGVMDPIFWGSVAVLAALVPMLGSTIVTVPAAVLFLLGHHLVPGLGLLVWAVFVGSIDNILRPFLIQRGMNIHPLFILLSVLGGLSYFGPVGFLAGPIVLAFFFVLLDIYPEIIKGRAIENTATLER